MGYMDMHNQCKNINGKYQCIKREGHKGICKDFCGNKWHINGGN